MQKNIETNKFSHKDDRDQIIKTAKKEAASMEIYGQASDIFDTKRWEDDMYRVYQYAAPAGYIGNLVSIVLGVSGGVFLAYNLTSNWASAIVIGVVVTVIMELSKSVSLREATIHALKGKTSAVILGGIALTMIVASSYFSVESGKETPYFQKWVAAETTTTATPLPSSSQYQEKIAELRAELRAIDTERDAYTAKNPTKGAKWLKADRYESLKAEINDLQKEAATNTAEEQAITTAAAQADTENSLSWWYWAIVILSEACVIFGYMFRPYYLYRCRELAIAEGKDIKKEILHVDSAPTRYEAVHVQQTISTREQELLAELARLKQQQHTPPPQNVTKTPMGFRRYDVDTVSTQENIPSVDTNRGNSGVDTVDTPDYSQLDEASLLGHYRQLNSNIRSWQQRNTETSLENIATSHEIQEKILAELKRRGKTIKMVARRFVVTNL